MPTETDAKLAADLADFRVETERRFGQLGQQLAEFRGAISAELAKDREEFVEFRGAVQTELGLIRKLGDRLFAAAIGVIGTIIIGSATIAWAASGVVSDVKHQGERIDKVETGLEAVGKRIDKVESRLEAVGKQLDVLLSRMPPKSGG